MQWRHFLLAIPALFLSMGFEAQTLGKGAKDLFYDPTDGSVTNATPPSKAQPKKPAGGSAVRRVAPVQLDDIGRRRVSLSPNVERRPNVVGLSYWIELQGVGGMPGVQVANSRLFQSGERIRLHFRSNIDGNIALMQIGSSGTSQFLFPNPDLQLTDSQLRADEDRILPSSDCWFRFDENRGTERLVIVFARDRGELDGVAGGRGAGAGSLAQAVQKVKGSKDLLIETETRTTGEVGTYAVNLVGQPVVLEITLTHQ